MNLTDHSATALLNSILTASQHGVAVFQAVRSPDTRLTDLRLIMLNAVAEGDVGQPSRAVLGQPLDQVFPQLAGTDLADRCQRVLDSGKTDQFEGQFTWPGQVGSVWLDLSVIKMEDTIILSYRDVTQSKADAEAARYANVLERAFNASINGITVLEAMHDQNGTVDDFRFVMINEAGLRMSGGYTREQLLGHTLWEIYPATGINGLFTEYVRVYESGTAYTGEKYYPEYDIWRDLTIAPVQGGVMITYLDITARKKTEAALAEQAQLMEGILEGVPVGIAIFEAVRETTGEPITDFRIRHTNSILQWIISRSFTPITAQLLSDLFGSAVESGLFSRCVLAIELDEYQEFELPFGAAEEHSWYRMSISPKGEQLILTATNITANKQAQLVHHQQSVMLSSVLDGSQNAIIAFDSLRDKAGQLIDFRYVLQNEINRQRVGRTDEQLLGHTMLEFYPHLKDNGLFAHYAAVVNTGVPYRQDVPFDYGTGMGWYGLSVVKRGDGIVLTVQDKTAEKQADMQLQAQAKLLQTISDSTPAGLVLWETVRDDSPQRNVVDFRYRMANLMNTLVTGQPAETLIGNLLFDTFPRFRGTEVDTALRDVVETGRTQRMVFTYYTEKPGWFDAQFIRVDDGVLMTFMDVTERHKAQLDQKKQADFLQTIIDSQPVGIQILNPVCDEPDGPITDFVIMLINKAGLAASGRTDSQEVIGKQFRLLFPSEEGQSFFEKMVHVFDTEEPIDMLLPYFSDGVAGWFQVSLFKHHEQIIVVFMDVSSLKEQQQALEQANLDLKRSNENLQQFAYIASHDLQEPLRKIQSFGNILVDQYTDSLEGDARDMLRRIQEAAQRMSLLISDLLNYSRIANNRAADEPVPLTALLTDLMDELSVSISEADAVIELGDLPTLPGDKNQLRQLFQNLISNALKFRQAGIRPHIRVTSHAVADLPQSANATDDPTKTGTRTQPRFYRIDVTDNGIGFDEKYLDRIFQVFQRLHTRSQYPGTGVGLAICQKVAESHQGVLTASSQLGQGATFSLYLPLETTSNNP